MVYEFNHGYGSFSDEVCAGHLNVVQENINAFCELVFQDRYETSCEIMTSLRITGTSIHSILCEHLGTKNLFVLLNLVE